MTDTEFINNIKKYVFATTCLVYLDIVETYTEKDGDIDFYFLSIETMQLYLNESYHTYNKKENKTLENIFNKILNYKKINSIVCLIKLFNFLSVKLITNTILHLDAINILKNMDTNNRLKTISENLYNSLDNDILYKIDKQLNSIFFCGDKEHICDKPDNNDIEF